MTDEREKNMKCDKCRFWNSGGPNGYPSMRVGADGRPMAAKYCQFFPSPVWKFADDWCGQYASAEGLQKEFSADDNADRLHETNTPDEKYRHALHQCAERYRDMMIVRKNIYTPDNELWKFTMQFMFGCRDGMPVAKLCRWLGYIQGQLIAAGVTDVETERDWTRPLFRPLDY